MAQRKSSKSRGAKRCQTVVNLKKTRVFWSFNQRVRSDKKQNCPTKAIKIRITSSIHQLLTDPPPRATNATHKYAT